ncbi:FAD/NAD(P)-binding domain-containing protein [Mollisia scopiformis]|uniref:FAD/NAD(P)-binding domain-containing protein n=1 Tax=Mollisia scopiformis TaxID=149040 RepID=A0A132BC20_MOLSC|nr:FAD/NAD(P)-binding domain-containing protein [Mollisia scopiformis]KUJ09970.1 FAD/NAD(P)-binding domain-containing protein [Mollisia scopiformis]
MEDQTRKVRIAISGGGLAGLTLLNGLLKYPHLSVEIFESATNCSERGAAVSLGINAQNALHELGPVLEEAVSLAGAIPYNSSRAMIGLRPNAGSIVIELKGDGSEKGVHRAALLSELLKPIPQIMTHTNKKLIRVQECNDGVRLFFEDGTKEVFDGLIGADGIHGYCREYILGAEHAALKPHFAGFWDCRSLVPIQKAKEVLGEKYFNDGLQHAWVGHGSYLMHDVLDNGETIQCVSSVETDENWSLGEWKRDFDAEGLKEAFSKWTDSPILEGMIEVFTGSNSDLRAYPQWEHSVHAPTYTKRWVCVIGDAAHAMTPWQGSGAGVALEDAMILDTHLQLIKDPHQIKSAFQAYDQVRRPRTQKPVDSSKTTGRIFCGRGPGVGLEPEELRKSLCSRWDFIYALDMKQHKRDALDAFADLNTQSVVD